MNIAAKFKLLLIGLLCILPTMSYANTLDYAVIIDAGSSGSRVYVVGYTDDSSAAPRIYPTLWSMKITPGLSTFKNNTNNVANYIGKLINYAQTHLAEAKYQGKPRFYLLGTAGMRLLSENDQNAIYAEVNTYVSNNTDFDIKQIETISGDYEGIYGWLSVNALNGKLYNNSKTQGILELGGASMQITFALDQPEKAANNKHLYTVKIDQKTFTLYSRSDLGLGQNEVINSVNSLACYPSGYTTPTLTVGNWNSQECKSRIDEVLGNAHLTSDLPIIPEDMSFIAFDGYYKTFAFFEGLHNTNLAVLQTNVEKVCSQPWATLAHNYSTFPTQDLAKMCFNGIYIAEILGTTNGYDLSNIDSRVITSSTIEGTDISWAYGALIYQLNLQSHLPVFLAANKK